MRVVAELHAVDLILSHQFEEEIGAASSENGLFIAKMEFSVRTGAPYRLDQFASNIKIAPEPLIRKTESSVRTCISINRMP